jgi:ribosomal protein L30E
MNMKHSTAIALLLTVLVTGANAEGGLTRAQVKAELAEAIRTGDISSGDDEGLTLNQENPSRYPAKPVVVGKTRDQVKAELAEAIRTGDISAGDDEDLTLTLNQENPSRYPAKPVVVGKTRGQVKAELAEAIRTGNISSGFHSGLNLNQLYPFRYANVSSQPNNGSIEADRGQMSSSLNW